MYSSKSYIIELSYSHLKLIAKMMHVARAIGEVGAEEALKELALQVDGIHLEKPERHDVWGSGVLAPGDATEVKGVYIR